MLPIHWLCITATKSHFNYLTYKTKDHWYFVDAHFNALSIQNLLPPIIVFIIICTYWKPLRQIATWPRGKAEHSNNLVLVTLSLLKFDHLAKWLISLVLHLFTGQYRNATSYNSPIIFLSINFSGNEHKEPGKNLLTYFVLHYLVVLIAPHFHRIEHSQPPFSHLLWPLGSPNQSGNIWSGTHISLLWAFRVLNTIMLLYVRLIVCLTVVFVDIWIINVTISV